MSRGVGWLSRSARLLASLTVLSLGACSSGEAPIGPSFSGASGSGTSGAGQVPTGGGNAGGQGAGGGAGTSIAGSTAGGSGTGAGGSALGGGGGVGGQPNAAGAGGSAGSGGIAGTSAGGTSPSAPVDAVTMVKAMGFGANIGNTLENTTTWETGWGQPLITKAYISGMASRGIKTVRVPVAWDTYATNGTIDATKLARVKEVVGWIIEAGMFAIVNIHWDNGWIDNEKGQPPYKLTDAIKAKFESYWKQIGAGFSGVGHQLILEGMNEEGRWTTDNMPYGPADIPPLNDMNQLFVTTVRGTGGFNATRGLLIAGFNTDFEKTAVPAFKVPTDPAGTGKLFLSLHYYTPYQFTILEDDTAFTTWGSDADKKQLEDLFNKAQAFSTERKIPIVLGEFATTMKRTESLRVAWMTAVAKAALSRSMVPVLWDTGGDIMRTDGSFSTAFQAVFNAAK